MQFYVLGDLRTDDWNYHAYASGMKPENIGEAPLCPVCGECIGMLPWVPPYHVEIVAHGKMLGDVVKCTGMSLLVSDRFRQAWQQEGLCGIEEFSPLARLRVRPARLGRRPLTYFHVAPQYYGTQIDVEHSLIEYNRPITCGKCKSGDVESVRGFAIDEASWTREDLFIAWGMSGEIIVTDRVRQLRDDYGLTNINLTPVEKYFWDPYNQWSVIDYSRENVAMPDEDDEHVSAVTN